MARAETDSYAFFCFCANTHNPNPPPSQWHPSLPQSSRREETPTKKQSEENEEIRFYATEVDWYGDASKFKLLRSMREAQRLSEGQQWWHAYSPSRKVVLSKQDGELAERPASEKYLQWVAGACSCDEPLRTPDDTHCGQCGVRMQ